MLKQIPTRLMLNIASVQSRGFGLEPESRLISPDDMAFWWEPGCLETFSQDMEEWLKVLQEKFRSCLQAPAEIAVRRALMQILEKGQDGFGSMHPFLFSEVFWDYIDHQSDPHVMAATRLLDTIMDNALRDKDRTKLDRYCAVLANRNCGKRCWAFRRQRPAALRWVGLAGRHQIHRFAQKQTAKRETAGTHRFFGGGTPAVSCFCERTGNASVVCCCGCCGSGDEDESEDED